MPIWQGFRPEKSMTFFNNEKYEKMRVLDEIWTNVRMNRELKKSAEKLLDTPRIKALGITSLAGLIAYCLRKELDRD